MPALLRVRKLFLQISAAGERDARYSRGPAVLEKLKASLPRGDLLSLQFKLSFILSLLFLKVRPWLLPIISRSQSPLRARDVELVEFHLTSRQKAGPRILFQTQIFPTSSYPAIIKRGERNLSLSPAPLHFSPARLRSPLLLTHIFNT